MGSKVYIDGQLVEREDAKISVFDHGLLYGDGVFEGIRAYNGKVFRLKEHVDRLFDSAAAIELVIPLSKEQLADAIEKMLEVNNLTEAYFRVIVTRGRGSLGLNPRICKNPCVIIITDSIALYPAELYKKGMHIITASTVRNHPNALDPKIKSLNYLNNILAKIEALNAGMMEAVMMNSNGYVAECTGDNIFIVKNNTLLTPPSSAGFLMGITRGVVFELITKLNLKLAENDLTRYDLYSADECFLTGTAAELIPVVNIDGRQLGTGKPGPITLKLLNEFHKMTRNNQR